MSKFLLIFAIAAGASYLLTPLVRRFAVLANITDLPNERKIHKKPIPLLGGFSVFIAFNLSVVIGLMITPSLGAGTILSRWPSFFICETIVLFLGFLDDLKHLKPSLKFVFQVGVGFLAFVFGFGIQNVANPFGGGIINLGLLSMPVTILWVVFIANALNLIDGLDGLAAGTAFIASMTIFAISFFNANEGIALVSIVLAGSVLGFLRYNFHPATIFLGDSGSLLLGFLLAIFSVQGSSQGPTVLAMMAPILALGLPIMDTLLSMGRRFLKSIHVIDYSTKKNSTKALLIGRFSVFAADKDHLHHRLLKRGFSQRKAVLILYGVCIGLSALAFLSFAYKNVNMIPFMGAILIAFFIGIRRLNYPEFKILENGLLIPIINFPMVSGRLFLAFFDLMAISFSAYLGISLLFKGFGESAQAHFIQVVPLLLLIKIGVFFLSGIYRLSLVQASLEEAARILGTIFLSSLSSFLIMSLIFDVDDFGGPAFFVLDFYLLLTLAGGFRGTFRVLKSYYEKGLSVKGRKVLIYGAGSRGSSVLKEIRHNGSYTISPVGFIDDDPQKIGRDLHGCPIIGALEDLDELYKQNDISEIIISTEKIGRDKVKKLVEFCEKKGIVLRQFEFRFYEFS
jgi:UDP-GlcNAc:undecaprenyl-phosphate GlcNAc-1-phosphate transferase